MSRRLKKNAETLHFLSKGTPRLNKNIIEHAGNDLIDSICECALNVLRGHVNLNGKQKKNLTRHKNRMRSLIDKKLSRKKKKVILSQKGGFVGTLLTTVLSSLIPIILSQLKRKKKR